MGKIYEPKLIRNVTISGATNVGKTTLAEAMLYVAGEIKEMGSIERGTTVMDYDEEEIAKKISIRSSLAHLEYNNIKINIIDTPGIPDMVAEVRSAFRVSEGIIFVINAVEGITIDTEKDWHFADDYKISRIVFINKMDEEGADFYKTADEMFEKFKKPVVPIELPIGKGKDFKGIIDLIDLKAVYYDSNNKISEGPVPDDMKELVKKYRDKLFDAVAETDDTLIEKYLNGEELTKEEVERGLKICALNNKIIPVVCGAGKKTIGVKNLLDDIINFLPSPLYAGEIIGTDPFHPEHTIKRHPDPDEPFSGFIFKTRIDPFAGKISYCRIRSGKINIGDEVLNVGKNIKEKINHLYMVNGKNFKEIQTLEAGDIAVFTKIASLQTGDTITAVDKPLMYEKIRFPSPSYFVSIHSSDRKNEDKLAEIFHQVSEEDPTFEYGYNEITKEMNVSCIGEIQAKLIFDTIMHKNKINFEVRPQRIAYKETITAKAEATYKHKKQSGGHGQYAEVYMKVEPLPRNGGFKFSESIFGGAIPKNYIPAIEKGAIEACEVGPVAGYPVVDLHVNVYDGTYHEVDSSDLSFRIASAHCVRLCLEKAKPAILEPIAKVKIYVNEENIGDVLSDLSTKRGKTIGMDKLNEDITVINAYIPYANALNYSSSLNSLTRGRGRFELEFDHYDFLPLSEYDKAKKQIEDMKREEEEKRK